MRKKSRYSVAKLFFRLAPMVAKSTSFLFVLNVIVFPIDAALIILGVIMDKSFFDAAANLAVGKTAVSAVVAVLALKVVVSAFEVVANGVQNFMFQFIAEKTMGKLSTQINRKIARLSAVDFEDTDKLDAVNKAEMGKNNAVWFVNLIILIFAFYIPYFIFMSWYLFTLKPLFVFAVVFVFLPTAFSQLVRTRYFTKLEEESAPVRREWEYYQNSIVSREYFKETRILGGFYFFKKLYMDTLSVLQKLRLKANIKSTILETAMLLVTVAGYGGILYMLFDALMKGEISVGAFAAVFGAIGSLYSIMEEIIYRHVGNISQGIGTIQNYVNFLDLKEREGECDTPPEWGDVECKDVSFKYPGADGFAVKGVSLTLKNGETLAIVGENGSGKSTLIRLISGIYPPTSGEVTFNGENLKKFAPSAIFCAASAVFQKYRKYEMTLSENISISDSARTADKSTLDGVCEMSGVKSDASDYPNGYDTMLSREYGGVDLSGGQWQRVAIARGFFRMHDMIVLDEPTAAIDPYEETRIYNRFAEISRDKTAVIVTHRLGSVKLADRIAVMKEGELVQLGTHNELINKDGEYKRLYHAQEQWYVKKA